MQADIVRELRAAGIPMRGRHMGRQHGWTTNPAIAETARGLGATVHTVTAKDPAYSGWEIEVPADPPEDDDAA